MNTNQNPAQSGLYWFFPYSLKAIRYIEIFGDDLILKRPFGDAIGLTIKDFNTTHYINENLDEKINMNDYAEILFLTKYLGDYNVTKFGTKTLTFENEGHTLVVERL